VVTILRDDPMDSYYAEEPERLLGASVEHAMVNPGNPAALSGHLPAAAFETPLKRTAVPSWGPQAVEVASRLAHDGRLIETADTFLSADRSSPAFQVSIRGIGDRYQMVCDGRTIEEIDEVRALLECYPGAVYVSQGMTYAVKSLDLVTTTVHLERVPEGRPAYTQARRTISVTPAGPSERPDRGQFLGPLLVTIEVDAFRYVDRDGTPRTDWRQVQQPAFRLETEGLLLNVPRDVDGGGVSQAAVHAAEHLLVNALPVVVTADRRDVGSTSFPMPTGHRMAFYDLVPGGLGIVRGALEAFREWLEVASRLSGCVCESGCPRCVYLGQCTNLDLDKGGAGRVLKACRM
jgi:DEAD/DEAH box helicase domain-containing protein